MVFALSMSVNTVFLEHIKAYFILRATFLCTLFALVIVPLLSEPSSTIWNTRGSILRKLRH